MTVKRLTQHFIGGLLLAALLTTPPLYAKADPQVLATIGNLTVTSDQLERAIASSPFGTQFPSMDRDDQAAMRGDLLRHLVASRLLLLEAERLQLDQSAAFEKELREFETGLLYRHYMDKLRERIEIPENVLKEMKRQFKGDPDGLAAAKSAWRVDRYRKIREAALVALREQRHVRIHKDRVVPNAPAETVLLEADGITIHYRDIDRDDGFSITPDALMERVYERAELLLFAETARDEGVDVSDKVEGFRAERLPALLLERQEKTWIPDEQTLRDYYQQHPEIGKILERRHIAQLVTATREEAETLRKRILAGESLFVLAGEYSIDPYGREKNGDMGWVKEGTGMPEIEQAIADLPDGEISPVIKTPRGYHLVTIIERQPGGQKTFAGIRDRVRQTLLSERIPGYVNELQQRYQVVWDLLPSKG